MGNSEQQRCPAETYLYAPISQKSLVASKARSADAENQTACTEQDPASQETLEELPALATSLPRETPCQQGFRLRRVCEFGVLTGIQLWPHRQVFQEELSPGSCPSS